MTQIAISNIAWTADDDDDMPGVLADLGVTRLEIAPTRAFGDSQGVTAADASAYRTAWADRGITLVAMQSLLYGRPDLSLFDAGTRSGFVAHLTRVAELASRLGVGAMVFGSPGNRRVPAGMTAVEASDIAVATFRELGKAAADNGTCLCIEPNPVAYDCNFVTRASEGEALVRAVDHPGFRLHLDTGAMTLAGDDPASAIPDAADLLAHFHASAPGLTMIDDPAVDHDTAASALRSVAYGGTVSIEMRADATAPAGERVRHAVAFARRVYG